VRFREGCSNDRRLDIIKDVATDDETSAKVEGAAVSAADSALGDSGLFGRLGSFGGIALQKLMPTHWAHTYLAPDSCGGERSGAAPPRGSSRPKRRACQWRADPSGVTIRKPFWCVA
jgi:hypothetical protein